MTLQEVKNYIAKRIPFGRYKDTFNEVAEFSSEQGGGSSYKVYTALLTQSGTNAPVATVLENTLGSEVVWTRQGEGSYLGTYNGLFSNPLKVGIILSSIENPITIAGQNNIDSMYIETATDGYLYNAFLEIRVYN